MSKSKNNSEEVLYCSFCGTDQNEVETIIAGPGVYICNGCVDTCLTIFHDRDCLEQLPEAKKVGVFHTRDEINIEKLGLKPRFKKISFELKKGSCIYLCPFSEPFNTIYEDHIRTAVENTNHTIFRTIGDRPLLISHSFVVLSRKTLSVPYS